MMCWLDAFGTPVQRYPGYHAHVLTSHRQGVVLIHCSCGRAFAGRSTTEAHGRHEQHQGGMLRGWPHGASSRR